MRGGGYLFCAPKLNLNPERERYPYIEKSLYFWQFKECHNYLTL